MQTNQIHNRIHAMARMLTLTLTIASTASLAQEPPSLYGIALGKPLPMPECASKLASGIKLYVKRTIEDPTCYEESIGFQIYFQSGSIPTMAKSGTIDARVSKGLITRVSIVTDGFDSQEADLGKLVAKFGSPSSLRRDAMVNGYGVRFSAITAEWKLGVNVLTFKGVFGKSDEGLVVLKSPEAIDSERRMLEEMSKDKNL